MVEIMIRARIISSIFIGLILLMVLTGRVSAQIQDDENNTLSRGKKYGVLFIQVNATRETTSDANLTVMLLVNCTADDVYVDYLNFSIYGYEYVSYDVVYEIMLFSVSVIRQTSLSYNKTMQENYNVRVPKDVWGLTYAKINLKYHIGNTPLTFDDAFSLTTVKNIRWQELEELEKEFELLNNTFWQIFEMNLTQDNLAQLNETYQALKGASNELNNTRMVVGILAVTTVFFVATTLYLVFRKPKEYW